MGSSLRVTPAADMPKECAANGGSLVIVNLQKTPLDSIASLCIYGKCDEVMALLMKKLDYQIPSWQMKKRLAVELSDDKKSLTLGGVDSNGSPYVLYKQIKVSGLSAAPKVFSNTSKAPYKITLPEELPGYFDIELTHFDHYAEGTLTIRVDV
jgi:NAD+-dependent protein deacetylase SIR2